ncbi:SMP-30/gluconolactonase/LRE family protein [Hyphobacterium sp. CCMP332]|uniref:SMP-30/gluconolactonase/LRE family protein n=1 Tax=Hyphobacterium sp. CCMP332 TaxID=2749086 RepID=UPI00165052E7|nr:SMP-30/gluconolactonase/LRE family protein [Hyphobacterium sp. CCMP332]QNL19691.1 SMP-30/gluconolactonase/LRE family protein [Hyphobacterium sp. CCMP332]
MPTRRDMLRGLGGATIVSMTGCRDGGVPGDVEIHDPAARALFSGSTGLRQLADGFVWSEGPAWDRERNCLYFTDVPGNRAFRWTDAAGLEVFLDPSGVEAAQTTGLREAGANGLWFGDDGWLYLCNHGMRAVQRLRPDTLVRETLVDVYEGQRFNSPNDLVRASDGSIYFTDPPYGLEGLDASPLKEMESNGVYRLTRDGRCERLFDQLGFPNGIALSPDERWLYVAQSDPAAPYIFRAPLDADGLHGPLERWFDTSEFLAAGEPGLPDGLCVSTDGTIFATGPGGVFVLSPEGGLLARIRTGRATANCAFGGEDGRSLFMTAHDRLLQLPVNAVGLQWQGRTAMRTAP